jgi:tripartite ATP-independent transporter DctP family solute receptor
MSIHLGREDHAAGRARNLQRRNFGSERVRSSGPAGVASGTRKPASGFVNRTEGAAYTVIRRRSFPRVRFLGALGAGSLGAAVRSPGAADETYTLRLGLLESAASVAGMAALRFAAAVGRRSNGQVRIEVYPNGQIANEEASIEGLRNGVVDFALQSTSFLSRLFPRWQVLDLPFLFKDSTAAFRVMDGPIGDQFLADLESKEIVGLCWGTDGLKQLETTSKEIVTPDDMKNLRIRTPPGAIYVATYQALGAVPVTINFNETYTALLQHVVDGVDTPLPVFTAAKFYTVAKHVARSNHVFVVLPLLGSKRKIESLPAPLAKIVKDEGKAVAGFWRASMSREESDDTQLLRSNGVTFSEIRYAAFRKAVEPVYEMVQTRVGGNLIEQILKATG